MSETPVRASAFVRRSFWVLGVWLALYELHLTGALPPLARPLFNRYGHDVVLLAAAGLCALRVTRCREERLAWGLIAGALLSWTLGEIYYTALLWDAKSIPVPSPADAGYLGVYPLAFTGLTLLLRQRVRGVSFTVWIDGVIAALAVAALSSAAVFAEVLRTIGGHPLSVATNLAYPLGDLLLLGVVISAFTLRRWRPDRSMLLLGGGIVSFTVADSLYLVNTAQNTYTQGGVFDVGWWAGIVLVAAAAWCPPAADGARARRQSMAAIVAPIGFALFGLGLLVVATLRHVDALAVALATASLLGVIARLVVTFNENLRMLNRSRREALTDALTGLGNRRQLMLDLEQRCADRVAAPGHLALFDLNGFKLYNDRFGHVAGDALLMRLSRQFRAAVAPYGRAYRMGGDEFCALVQVGESTLRSVVAAAASGLSEEGEGFNITPSFGSVCLPAEAREPSEVLRLADTRMYHDKEQRRGSRQDPTRGALLQALQERHPELHAHLSQVAELSRQVAFTLGLAPEQIDEVVRAAELHDVGKMAIPDSILDKPGPLNEAEWAFMQRHTLVGERILLTAPALAPIATIVRSSHERVDGAGYPDGLAGDAIPLGSRIVLACDAYCAMTTPRPYAPTRSRERALAELHRCSGSQFDPDVVRALGTALAQAGPVALALT